MAAIAGTFYKAAQPDGWDFYSGRTINYRDAVGTTVSIPRAKQGTNLCTAGLLHASRDANGVFAGGSIPLSLFEVTGTPVADDGLKQGFHALHVERELVPEQVFAWKYTEAAQPVNPLLVPIQAVTSEHLRWLAEWASVRDSVRYSVRDSVGASVRDSVGASVRYSVGDSVGDSVWAYVGDIFSPVVPAWQDGRYPFASAVNLWRQGFVPSFDGKRWRLHAGPKAAVVHEAVLSVLT